jgi:hypothetical protein
MHHPFRGSESEATRSIIPGTAEIAFANNCSSERRIISG